MDDHPLKRLDGLPLGAFSLCLDRLETMRMSGWRSFSFTLCDASGRSSEESVIAGIYSLGGKGVLPWIEVANYSWVLAFGGGGSVDLRMGGLDCLLFRNLHDLLVPGSHVMLWYEGGSGRETDIALSKGVPPLITPLGLVLLQGGFISVRDFHLPEGGHEGGRKLWGERPLNEATGMLQRKKSTREALSYFINPIRLHLLDLEIEARKRAIRAFRVLNLPREIPELFATLEGVLRALMDRCFAAEKWPEVVKDCMEDLDARTRRRVARILTGDIDESLSRD